jgi:hypothetical protein
VRTFGEITALKGPSSYVSIVVDGQDEHGTFVLLSGPSVARKDQLAKLGHCTSVRFSFAFLRANE